jgi:hypothetical protein
LFIAPLELQIDTRIPRVCVRWATIGRAIVTYQNDYWQLNIRVLFFHKEWNLEQLIFGKKKKARSTRDDEKPIVKRRNWARKFFNVIRTFRVAKWQIAIDTGDVTKNAWLYALNFSPNTRQHLYINFIEENYVLLIIRSAPWKLAYAFWKK